MKNKILPGLLILYSILLYLYESQTLLYFGVDWQETYYPAVMLLLQGKNPYAITTLHNPVWVLFPLIPLALVGEKAGEFLLFFAAFWAYVYVVRRLGATSISQFLYMASPLIVYNLMLGNIDWLVALGFIMPPSAGLFFVLLKPQIGIAVVVYWLWECYQSGGVKNVIKTFLPVTFFMALSFVFFGNWLTGKSDNLVFASWNLQLFPYSVPLGFLLLYMARKNKNYAISASPFFSPYMSFGSWSIAQLGLVRHNLLTFAITTGLWIMFFMIVLTR